MRHCTTLRPCPAPKSRRWLGYVLAALAGAGLSGAALANEPQSLVVTTTADVSDSNDNLTSLREAFYYASNLGGGTITFAPSLAGKTVLLSRADGNAYGPTAFYTLSGSVTIDGGNLGVTIARDPAVPNLRLFEINQGSTFTLKSLTLRGACAQGFGAHEGGAAAGLGGAIAVWGGTLNLQGVAFLDNQAIGGSYVGTGAGGGSGLNGLATGPNGGGFGGGASAQGTAGNGNINSGGGYGSGPAGVGGNGAFGSGGGLGDATGGIGGFGGGGGGSNQDAAHAGAGGFGGGRGTLGFGGGGAGLGGAIFNLAGVVNGTNVTFSGNAAIGGMANPAVATVANNGSGYGGAIFNLSGTVKLTHATLANNIAAQGGGAIYNVGDNGVAPQTISNPRQTSPAAPAKITLVNTILSGSNDGAATPVLVSDFVQTPYDSGNGTTAGFVASDGAGVLIQTRTTAANDFGGTALTADPLLQPLRNYGGPTSTFALRVGSPALNAGVGTAVSIDQRGVARTLSTTIVPGLVGNYYSNVTASTSLLAPISNLEALTPTLIQITPNVDFGVGTETVPGDGSVLDRQGQGGNVFGGLGINVGVVSLAALWTGTITVPQTATYRFTTRSDDGSALFIDGQQVVDNNFLQGMTNRSGTISLTAGRHTIKIGYYQGGGGWGMQASWEQLDGTAPFTRQIIPPGVLSQALLTVNADIGAFEATDTTPPAGGTFTVLPGSSVVKVGTQLATIFTGWTDESSFQYEVSDNGTVLFPLGTDPVHFFTLPAGPHSLSARVVDYYGLETALGPVAVVVDAPPQITVPDDISVVAHTEDEAVISFNVTVTDDNDPHPVVTVSTPSGSEFPDGTTTVTVTATDAAGNVTQKTFHVTVSQDFVAYRKPFALDGLVPGAGDVGSGIEEEMLFNSFGSPAINSAGNVALLAKKHIGKVKYNDITFQRGARDASSGLPTGKRLARVGDVVPGISNVVGLAEGSADRRGWQRAGLRHGEEQHCQRARAGNR